VTTAIVKQPACARLLTIAPAGYLPTAPTPPRGTRTTNRLARKPQENAADPAGSCRSECHGSTHSAPSTSGFSILYRRLKKDTYRLDNMSAAVTCGYQEATVERQSLTWQILVGLYGMVHFHSCCCSGCDRYT
jgi:hypothetical protein